MVLIFTNGEEVDIFEHVFLIVQKLYCKKHTGSYVVMATQFIKVGV